MEHLSKKEQQDNWKVLGFAIAVLAVIAVISTMDYTDQRQTECLKKGLGYNPKTDKCEGEL